MFSGKIWGLFTLSNVLKCQSMNASWSSRLWFFDLLAAADFCKGRKSSEVAWTLDSGCCCLGEHQVPDGHKAIQPAAASSHQSLSSSRSTRKPGCYWALIQNLRQSSFDFKTCLPVISTPSAPTDPGQRQVWEKLKTKSRMFAVSCHSHIMHTACFS